MGTFIQGDNFDRSGGEYEKKVWESIKRVFNKRECLAYSRYPLFQKRGERRKEPDIILLDREVGFIVIEVKGYKIDDIESLEANSWEIVGFTEETINPLAQVEDYVYGFIGKFSENSLVRRKYKAKGIVALPEISKEEFQKKGYLNKMDEGIILFKEDLEGNKLIKKIEIDNYIENTNDFNDQAFKVMQSILGHEINFIEDIPKKEKIINKRSIVDGVKNKLFEIDLDQERIGKSIAPGPQRIRGIAGSGKTLLLCQKAAYLHLKHPDYRIAITFFTQSLYDTIIKTLDMYIRAFTNGEESYDENSNLKVLHAWGSTKVNGFYREIAIKNNVRPLGVKDVNNALGEKWVPVEDSINYISKDLLKKKDGVLEKVFDAVFIDEGQDLVGRDEFKYNGKQAFYFMAYQAIKANEEDDKEYRRIIWGYDELQSLNEGKIPSGKELFGDSDIVKGAYKGNIKKSEVMKKCYRTPYQILTAAHAIGMGIFREGGMITGYTSKKDWENIGYTIIKGNFKSENDVILERDRKNNANIIEEFYKEDLITLSTYNSETSMFNALAKKVKNDIKNEKLNPSREILIINLGDKKNQSKEEIAQCLIENNINFYIPKMSDKNVLKEHYLNNKATKFWCEDAVTISGIEMAKGNEAAMVYVVGIENIAKNEKSIADRNRLFTAITRTKCFVHLLGVGDYNLYREIEKAKDSKGRFEFRYTKMKRVQDDDEV